MGAGEGGRGLSNEGQSTFARRQGKKSGRAVSSSRGRLHRKDRDISKGSERGGRARGGRSDGRCWFIIKDRTLVDTHTNTTKHLRS